MIIDNDTLLNKTNNSGWVETYKYDIILEGFQERSLDLVLKHSKFIIEFFEHNIDEGIYPFKESSFLALMYWEWILFDSYYYNEKIRTESYWNNRISIAGGSLPYNKGYSLFNATEENREDDNHILNLFTAVGENLEADLDWKILPTPVKMYYCMVFIVNTFDTNRYFNGRHHNWINSVVCVEPYEDCNLYDRVQISKMMIKDITAESMLKTFFCNSKFWRDPLQYADPLLKGSYTKEDIYSKLYVPLFSEICKYLDDHGCLQGLKFNVTSTSDNRVFDKDSYREAMADIETKVINSRFAAEKPMKDAEQGKQESGRRKQSRIRNNNTYNSQLIVMWVLIIIGCLMYSIIK